MTGRLAQSALRELLVFLRSPRFWGTFAAVVVLFWITAPFGTASLPAAPRLGFWLVLHVATWACALVFVVLADIGLEGRIASRFARMMSGALLAAPLIGLVTETLRIATFGGEFTPASYGGAILTGLALSALFCVLTWLSMNPVLDGDPAAASPPSSQPAPQELGESALLRRLNPHNRGAPLHLAGQDHYVEVVTTRGRELILMRFADALAELGDAPGLRVHRSHWVADAAVTALERDSGRPVLVLASGTRVPVSRPYVAVVRRRWG